MKHTLRSVAIGVTAGVLAATGVTVAAAQIPSADGTVTACMVKPGGTIRLIDAEAGATCKKREQLVTWNSQGQPGADGVSGYEIVSIEGSQEFTSTVSSVFHTAVCPEGKVALGAFPQGVVDPPTGSNVLADVAGSQVFENGNGLSQVNVFFAKGDRTAFTDGDALGWTIRVTCAVMAP